MSHLVRAWQFDFLNITQWAYGVTCWEIFSGGRVPYSDLAVRDILSELLHGNLLEKPENQACFDDM